VKPTLDQINLVVRNLEKSLAFYRGLDFGEPTGLHAAMTFPGGLRFDLDQHEFAKQWNSGTPALNGGSVVLCLSVPERDDVDTSWQRMVDAGYKPLQMPYDAFWGSRFAVIEDPDGYQIGLMSPSVAGRRYWPPVDAPGHPSLN